MNNQLSLDEQSVCSSLGKTLSPAPSIPLMPVVLCVVFVPGGLYPSLWHVYCCVFVQLTFGEPCWGDCLVQPLVLLGDNVLHQNLILWLKTAFDQIEPSSSS